jgi:hypothetical protein
VPEHTTVVRESAVARDGLYGFLVAAFALALVRGFIGARTTEGRIVCTIVFSTIVIVGLYGWQLRHRRSKSLAISDDAIVLLTAGLDTTSQLLKTDGDRLQFVTIGSIRYRSLALKIRGRDTTLSLQFFSKKPVQAACVEHGWHFD